MTRWYEQTTEQSELRLKFNIQTFFEKVCGVFFLLTSFAVAVSGRLQEVFLIGKSESSQKTAKCFRAGRVRQIRGKKPDVFEDNTSSSLGGNISLSV